MNSKSNELRANLHHLLFPGQEPSELVNSTLNEVINLFQPLLQQTALEARIVQLGMYMGSRCGCLNCDTLADDLALLTAELAKPTPTDLKAKQERGQSDARN